MVQLVLLVQGVEFLLLNFLDVLSESFFLHQLDNKDFSFSSIFKASRFVRTALTALDQSENLLRWFKTELSSLILTL